jgi:hypothetical protein
MNISSLDHYSNNNLASELSNLLQSTGLASTTSSTSSTGTNSTTGSTSDSSQLSPFAQLLSTLQQLQQSNPTQYAAVTKQIATNLTAAAQTATQNGNTAQANQLTQLAKDFTIASTSGQLPNIQDLAKALGSGAHHHHMHAGIGAPSSDPDGDGDSSGLSTATSSSTSTTNQALEQILAAFQSLATNGSAAQQSATADPMSIIVKTLSSAGISLSSSNS